MTTFGISARNGGVALRTGGLTTQPTIDARAISTVLPTTVPSFRSPAASSGVDYSPYRTSTRRPFSSDTLNVSQYTIRNNTIQNIINSGFSSSRPELIGLIDFKPFFTSENDKTDFGNLSVLKFQSELLRKNILDNIKDRLNKSSFLENINQDIARNKNEIETELNFLITGYQSFEEIKKSLNIKSFSDTKFDLVKHENIENIFTNYLQFSRASYQNFSNTKILYQLTYDFRKIIETHSYNLFDSRIRGRGNTDNSGIQINKSTNQQENFYTTGLSAAQFPFTQSGLESLNQNIPVLSMDRVKFILNFLSKELRVSKALDELEIQRQLRTNFLSQNVFGNPFDNIFGQVGDDIYQIPIGQNSIASNFLITAQQNIKILPFEEKEIDEDENVFLPGTRYFIDSILDSENSTLNLNPLIEFKNNFNTIMSNAEGLINRLLPSTGNLTQQSIFLNFITKIRNSFSTLDTAYENKLQLIIIALLNAARRDSILKLMLFQYFLLLGLTDNQTGSTDGPFANFAFELRELRGLNFVGVTTDENPNLLSGRSGLGTYLERICETIENHVFPVSDSVRISDLNPAPNELASGNLKELLLNVLVGETPNLFKNIIEFSKNIYYQSAITRTEINGTKYNNVSTSLLLGLVFEAFLSFCSLFESRYSQITSGILTIERNKRTNSSVLNSLDILSTSERPNFSNTDIFRFGSEIDEDVEGRENINIIQNLKSYLIFEDKIIYDFLHIFSVLRLNLVNSVNNAITFFQNPRIQIVGKQNFKKNNLKTSLEIYHQYKDFLTNSSTNSFAVNENEYKALNSLLKLNEFKSNTNKLFVVGISNGLAEKLINKFSKNQITNKEKRKLINVVVYKVSIKNSKIIFKPKKIIFDLELSENNFAVNDTIDEDSNFYESDGIAEKFSFYDESVINLNNLNDINLNKTEIYNSENIGIDIKKEIIKNHIKNYLFKKYIKLTTGYNFSEESFPILPYSQNPTEIVSYLSQNVIQFNREYLTNVLGFSDSEAEKIVLESNKKIINRTTAHDDSRIILTAPEFLNSTEFLRKKIFNEKKFEKVLLICLDLNSFSVDVDKTSETQEGADVIRNLTASNKLNINLVDGEYYIQNESEFYLDDYFVCLETI